MTRNEKIAEKMGWVIFKDKSLGIVAKDQDGDGFPFMPESITSDSPTGHWLAHLLIERMVADGWEISMMLAKGCTVQLDAYKRQQDWKLRDPIIEEFSHDEWCFPAAVVELFCKVYGILDGE